MTSDAKTVEEYIENLPPDRRDAFIKLRNTILENIPEGFEEVISYGMVGYVVPHSLYPSGYHCDPKLPLPFAAIGNQKNSINLYHSGIYSDKELSNWFQEEYSKHIPTKIDMGKSCVRFKNMKKIPYPLIGELMRKISVQEWVEMYESKRY